MLLRCLPLLLAASAAMAQEATPPFTEPEGTLTLETALEIVLAHNPELAALAWESPIAEAETLQAGLRPNPELGVEVENLFLDGGTGSTIRARTIGLAPDGLEAGTSREQTRTGGGVDELDTTLRLSQVFELGGKRAARVNAAKLAESVAAWDYEAARYAIAGDTVAAFTEVLAAREHVAQRAALVALAEKLDAAVGGQVEAGHVSPLDERRARAELERVRIEEAGARATLDRARLRMAALWGSTNPRFESVEGSLDPMPELPALDALFASRAEHPLLKRWDAELARREALVTLEERNAVPDLTVGLGYRASALDGATTRGWSLGTSGFNYSRANEEPDDTLRHSLVLEGSIPLPLFNRNQGSIRAAELRARQAEHQQRAADAAMETALTEWHAAAAAAYERAEALAARVVPELETTSRLTREGYELGKFDLLAVLEADRALTNARLDLTDARIAYHRAIAGIERTAGLALPVAVPDAAQPLDGASAAAEE
ncbi:MAG: hypothetical protein GC168_07175 [Candidatus Hydrogenedens sp.]|nr:hypothetical protein [Candidatus Hydrogenedens sp.]